MGLTQKLGTIPLAIFTDASNNIGIGGSPSGSYKLDVTGTGRFTGALTGAGATFSGLLISNTTDAYPEFRTTALDADVFLGFANTGDNNNAWSIGRRNTGEFWISNYTGNFNSGTRTTPLVITPSGNVGINTTSPSALLHVNGTQYIDVSSGNNLILRKGTGQGALVWGGTNANEAVFLQEGLPGGGMAFYTSSGTISSPSWSERWRITTGGVLASNGNSTESSGGPDKFSIGYSNGNYGWLQSWGGTNIYINRLGNAVYAGTQRIDNNSDQRLKENITSVENALDIILNLKGRKFNMIDENGKLRYGFVAQEVQPYLADFVTESVRSYEKDDIKIENLLTLESSGAAWAAILIEAIKELSAKVSALENK